MTKTLPPSPEDRHLFIVRVWREDSPATPGGQWRGSVEHVPSGQRIHFVSLEALNEFMRVYMNVTLPASPPEGTNHDE
jgi:hypothetical protein